MEAAALAVLDCIFAAAGSASPARTPVAGAASGRGTTQSDQAATKSPIAHVAAAVGTVTPPALTPDGAPAASPVETQEPPAQALLAVSHYAAGMLIGSAAGDSGLADIIAEDMPERRDERVVVISGRPTAVKQMVVKVIGQHSCTIAAPTAASAEAARWSSNLVLASAGILRAASTSERTEASGAAVPPQGIPVRPAQRAPLRALQHSRHGVPAFSRQGSWQQRPEWVGTSPSEPLSPRASGSWLQPAGPLHDIQPARNLTRAWTTGAYDISRCPDDSPRLSSFKSTYSAQANRHEPCVGA